MKKVLVPLETHNFNDTVGIEGVLPIYLKKLVTYNLLPLLVSNVKTKSMIDALYNEADGIYLTGGNDWDSSLYQQQKHPLNDPATPARDGLEMHLLKKALKDKKPVLAICRGAQGIAIAAGGTLHQHIPDVFPQEDHTYPKGANYETLLRTPKKHPVHIKPDTKISKIVRKKMVMVNSFHHQAINNPGKHFIASGFSPAGVIEIIEHVDPNYFCIGVQSHPEVEENSFFEGIFASFGQAVNMHKNTPITSTGI